MTVCGRGDIGKIATADHCLVVSGAGKDKLQGFVPLVSLDSISDQVQLLSRRPYFGLVCADAKE